MACSDCDYRQREVCCLFDDIVLSYANSCFMDTTKEGIDDD